MTKIQATAKCPSCKWKYFDTFESEQPVLDLVHTVNTTTVDHILLDHMKSHKAISTFILEAAKEVPIDHKSHNGFRGSFDLRYKELP
jgi:hypothetical protein